MIELRKLSFDNWNEIADLKVADNQVAFVEISNLYQIAELHIYTTNNHPAIGYGIYADDVPVGFVRYSYWKWNDAVADEPMTGNYVYFIDLMMIDENHQGKGYGKLAFGKLVELIKKKPYGESKYLGIGYSSENIPAKNLYASFGFVESVHDGDKQYAYLEI